MPEQKSVRTIHIDLNKLLEIGNLGIRRAYVFSGYGINAARDERLNTFDIGGPLQITIVPPLNGEKQIEKSKKAFEQWIIGNAFRELFEAQEMFANEIFNILLHVEIAQGRMEPLQGKKNLSDFQRKGIYEKLSILRRDFGLRIKLGTHLRSINKARNCLTHNRGIVRKREEASGRDRLTMKWRRLKFAFHGNEGQNVEISAAKIPFETPGEGHLSFSVRDRQKSFLVGKPIVLKPEDIHEICFTYVLANTQLFNGLKKKLKQLGIMK